MAKKPTKMNITYKGAAANIKARPSKIEAAEMAALGKGKPKRK